LRKKFPRINQGEYNELADRTDPVSILEEQGRTRLPELVPIRYARMLDITICFPAWGRSHHGDGSAGKWRDIGIQVQACGDMHVANFGVFASAERNLIFGINDFDETLPGPWEWDLKRLVASIVASGRFLGADKDLSEESVMAAVRLIARR
jgi:Uncharacterized protein conserved in bacteria